MEAHWPGLAGAIDDLACAPARVDTAKALLSNAELSTAGQRARAQHALRCRRLFGFRYQNCLRRNAVLHLLRIRRIRYSNRAAQGAMYPPPRRLRRTRCLCLRTSEVIYARQTIGDRTWVLEWQCADRDPVVTSVVERSDSDSPTCTHPCD